MSNIDGYSIATLVLFIVSIFFVIKPVSFNVPIYPKVSIPVSLGLMSAPIIVICILWASGCIGATQIRDGIIGTNGVKPYNILILFISLAYMAITLDVTGILKSAAFWVSNKGGTNARRLYLYFYLFLTGISMIIGNDPIILSGTVFLVYYTEVTGLEPLPWLISEFAAANTASMVLFVGNPTNVVICEGFGVNNAAFTAYTILPFVACSVACLAGLAFQFRNPVHIPKSLPIQCELNPLEVLEDRVGAIVGTILLVTCLAVTIGLSFLHIDVWKIILPFAIAKFIFDLSWDHYRYVKQGDSKHFTNEEMKEKMTKRSKTLDVNDPVAHTVTAATSATMYSTHSQGRTKSELEKRLSAKVRTKYDTFARHFPTLATALPRLPFGLIPFAFSQFILIEGLEHRGWIEVFAKWLVKASHEKMIPTIWLIGVLGVILCNCAGTNIGATILLTKVVRAAQLPDHSTRAAAIALAVASNIGAVSFTFSASLAGLLWDSILRQMGVNSIRQKTFAFWNMLPLVLMTAVGLGVVTAQMVVLYR